MTKPTTTTRTKSSTTRTKSLRGELYRCGIHELWHREIGTLSPPAFAHRIGGCEDLIKRLELSAELDGHLGCVNTVHFNPSGDILVSGSDDMDVVFWDWAAKRKRFAFPSGHENNVFQARIMPLTDNRSVVTCAADGQVRHAEISTSGTVNTVRLAKHRGRAHKLAIEPGSPRTFFSCGEDGVVRHFDLREGKSTVLLTCYGASRRPFVVHLNAIIINPRKPHLFAVGGSDEYARVYDIRKISIDESRNSQPVDLFAPKHLIDTKEVHITCIAYSQKEELLVSYNDELIYMFDKGAGLGPMPPRKSLSQDSEEEGQEQRYQVYKGHRNAQTVKGVNFFGPNSEYVVSGSDCGHIFIWKKRGGELVSLMKGDSRVVNCLEPHPSMTVLATSGIDRTVKIWTPTASKIQPLPANAEKIMEKNRLRREERSHMSSSIMRLLMNRRRVASSQGRWSAETDQDEEADDEDGDAIYFGHGDDSSDAEGNECIIS